MTINVRREVAMNRLSLDRQAQAISFLVEGNSIRSTERMTDIHRDTIMRLLVRVGDACASLMEETMRDLTCERIQVDEIWAFVGKKQRQVKATDDRSRVGDMWTYVALDADTKLVPSFLVGKRDAANTRAFISDLSERLVNRVQLSSDALNQYVVAVEEAFGTDIDYGQVVKFYEAEPIGPGRYSPPRVKNAERTRIQGRPREADISTSYVERQNLTMRMNMRRFTRLTNAFSEGRESPCSRGAALRALQLCADAQQPADHPGDGGWRDEPAVEPGGVGGASIKLGHYRHAEKPFRRAVRRS